MLKVPLATEALTWLNIIGWVCGSLDVTITTSIWLVNK